MKKLLFTFLVGIISFAGIAQNVGIGNSNPHPSAALDITDTSRGILIPRMTMTQRNSIQNPADGLMVYQTDSIYGYYYYAKNQWLNLINNYVLTSNTKGCNRIGISSSKSWICPSNVYQITVELWGAGGGGSCRSTCGDPPYCNYIYFYPNQSGGKGGFSISTVSVQPGQAYQITIGQAGCQGEVGGSTSFANIISAPGGGGGTNIIGANGLVSNWPYTNWSNWVIPQSISYIPSSNYTNTITTPGLASGGNGGCDCQSSVGQNGFAIVSY